MINLIIKYRQVMIQKRVKDLLLRDGLKAISKNRFAFSEQNKNEKEKKVHRFSLFNFDKIRNHISNKKYSYLPLYLKYLNS